MVKLTRHEKVMGFMGMVSAADVVLTQEEVYQLADACETMEHVCDLVRHLTHTDKRVKRALDWMRNRRAAS